VTPPNERVIAVCEACGVGAASPAGPRAAEGVATLVGEAATSAICEVRAGLALAGALELIVGTLDAAARLPETTRAAGEICGPPAADWLSADAAPEVACRARLEEDAATAAGLLFAVPAFACVSAAVAVETAGGACEVLRLAIAERTACDTSGVASPARGRVARAAVAVGAVGAEELLGLPSAMATSGAVTACLRVDEAAAEIWAVWFDDAFGDACATAAVAAAAGLRLGDCRATVPVAALATSVGVCSADRRAACAAAGEAGAAVGAAAVGWVSLVAAAWVRATAELVACIRGLASALGAGEGATAWATVAASGRLVVRVR